MAKTDWQQVWDTRPRTVGKRDYFRQVGKTVRGQPLTPEQFAIMLEEIVHRLQLSKSDVVLDLCCGNGVITRAVAATCDHVVGVDFSEPLIEIARRDHNPSNIDYIRASVLELEHIAEQSRRRFTKVLMYDALQHFDHQQLRGILNTILKLTAADALLLFGGIPRRRYRDRFFDTPRKRLLHMYYKLRGRDLLGTWWDDDDFLRVCGPLNLECTFHNQSPDMYNAKFRFDVVISKRTARVA
jgi:cyclopropane fatty-acyl-phospholipid synthase-like methyltransferase